MLRLRNPRVRELDLPTGQLYYENKVNGGRHGFRLTGYRGELELYSRSPEELALWLEKLKRVGVFFNLVQNYTFGKVLGKGNFAKVLIA